MAQRICCFAILIPDFFLDHFSMFGKQLDSVDDCLSIIEQSEGMKSY